MDLYYDTFEIGKNDVQGLLDGTSALSSDLITKYREMAEAALAEYKKTVGQHSPSVKYREAGAYDIRGLIEGAESEKGHLKEAYIELAEAGTVGGEYLLCAAGNFVLVRLFQLDDLFVDLFDLFIILVLHFRFQVKYLLLRLGVLLAFFDKLPLDRLPPWVRARRPSWTRCST